ncbi:hypothetical protein [Nocardioides sp.]|uniref:hypothetical protein n=1 Tax=Nocardioides sp. TaxID=35761 RepID=UPI00356351C4
MQINSTDATQATVTLTDAELRLLNNAMNEALEALDDDEFETRVGAERSEMQALLSEVNALIKSLA